MANDPRFPYRDELEMPAYASEIGDQNIDEPYRRKLSFMWRRLDADAYESVADFAADLELLDRSLHRGCHTVEKLGSLGARTRFTSWMPASRSARSRSMWRASVAMS